MKIGICDYGIGGVSLYQLLRKHTSVDVVYLSDTGYVPYGKVAEATLRERVEAVVDYLFACGADFVVIACNAASTVAPKRPLVMNMIDFGLQSVRLSGVQNLGIVGGYRTVESGVYSRPLATGLHSVQQIVAQELSILMEAGELESDRMQAAISRIFTPLSQCDGILLACTHYPVLAGKIQAVVPNTQLIDPMALLLTSLRARFPEMAGSGSVRWMTTGSAEKMRVAARQAFAVNPETIETIQL